MGKSKFKYKSIVHEGIVFKSTNEYNRYIELKILEKDGKIKELSLQPEFELFPKETIKGINFRRVKYTSDFKYIDCNTNKTIIEEVKSIGTAKETDYILRKRIFIDKYIKDNENLQFVETVYGTEWKKSKPKSKYFSKLFKTKKRKNVRKV